jgi:urease accessory protein
MKSFKISFAFVGALGAMAVLPSIAFAHPGHIHVHTLLAGLEHPVTGLDHILAMTAVGLWASQQGGRALWAWPAAFVSVMLFGGFLGMEGIALPLIEPAIAASILVLGLLIASATMLPVSAGALIIGTFALFHGNAHGLEAPATGASLLYALGFAASTALLHGVGLVLGLGLSGLHWQKLLRVGGAVTAGIGGILFFV